MVLSFLEILRFIFGIRYKITLNLLKSTILGIKVIHGILRDRLGVPEFKTAMYISFMHALVTGVGAYYIFWQTWTEFPLDMLKLKYFEIPGAEIVITMSIGVFSSSFSYEFHLKSI